mmetsp:Transcript_23089/g.39333  ORF Transcript_23089/g.39333 Transcript_23089/m.39333 type:complete len:211 (+) Transcript_23089:1569-2201(+)
MAKLSPSRNSTVVEVSRRLKASIWKLSNWNPFEGSMDDTAASSSRLIRSWSTTRGIKFSSIPKGLNSTVMVPLSWLIGTGYSPPARNFASCPLSATRLGSASVRTTPLVSRASSSRPTWVEPALKPKRRAPAFSLLAGTAPPNELVMAPDVTFVPLPPFTPTSPPKSVPFSASEELSDLETVRCISAKRTLSSTCWMPPTLIRLDTRPSA